MRRFCMQRILVTGGTGMLGRVLVPKLQAAGYPVRIMSRKPRPTGRDVPVERLALGGERLAPVAERLAKGERLAPVAERLAKGERLPSLEWAQANVLTG